MSSKPTLDPAGAHPHGKTSEDEINYGKIILVAVVSLIVFALSTVWAAIILRKESGRIAQAGPGAAEAIPREIGRTEIGIVDQVPFEIDQRLSIWRAERAARLNGYGWVDRSKGLAHIPIERAMDAVATGALPAGAPR